MPADADLERPVESIVHAVDAVRSRPEEGTHQRGQVTYRTGARRAEAGAAGGEQDDDLARRREALFAVGAGIPAREKQRRLTGGRIEEHAVGGKSEHPQVGQLAALCQYAHRPFRGALADQRSPTTGPTEDRTDAEEMFQWCVKASSEAGPWWRRSLGWW